MKLKIIFLIALLKLKRFGYIDSVRCKIIELVLADYQSLAHTVRFGLFLCVKSLCVRMLWRSWRGTSSDVLVTFYACLSTLSSFTPII